MTVAMTIRTEEKPDMVCGIKLRGLNLKEYMKGCLDGSITLPIGENQIVPRSPLFSVVMGCGEQMDYNTLEDMPEDSVPCTCGDPTHWFVYLEGK